MPIIGTPHTHTHTHTHTLAGLYQFRFIDGRGGNDEKDQVLWLKKQTIKRIQNAYFKIHLSFCDRRTNIEGVVQKDEGGEGRG